MWAARVFTLYPELFPGPLGSGLYKKALEKKLWSLEVVNIRDYASDKHKSVDDTPFGGGSGMVMRADVIANSLDKNISNKNEQIIYLILMGFIIIPSAFIVLTIAPRYAPAHEVTLIFLLESILGTLWVWFVISEKPPLNTLIGGGMLLSSVFVFVLITAKEEYKSNVS